MKLKIIMLDKSARGFGIWQTIQHSGIYVGFWRVFRVYVYDK